MAQLLSILALSPRMMTEKKNEGAEIHSLLFLDLPPFSKVPEEVDGKN